MFNNYTVMDKSILFNASTRVGDYYTNESIVKDASDGTKLCDFI